MKFIDGRGRPTSCARWPLLKTAMVAPVGPANRGKWPLSKPALPMGVIRLEKKYGSVRLETACGRALELQVFRYGFVAKMLQNNMDQAIAKRKVEASALEKPPESNTRGREYYH